jgi:hypothetical protein
MSTRCLNFDHQITNFSQAEKEMIVKVFREISKDFAELTKTAQMEKTADYTGCGFRTVQTILGGRKEVWAITGTEET